MTKEFNLSKERYFFKIFYRHFYPEGFFYSEKDVKEFIKLLKEEINNKNLGVVSISFSIDELEEIINKLAGEKLI